LFVQFSIWVVFSASFNSVKNVIAQCKWMSNDNDVSHIDDQKKRVVRNEKNLLHFTYWHQQQHKKLENCLAITSWILPTVGFALKS